MASKGSVLVEHPLTMPCQLDWHQWISKQMSMKHMWYKKILKNLTIKEEFYVNIKKFKAIKNTMIQTFYSIQ